MTMTIEKLSTPPSCQTWPSSSSWGSWNVFLRANVHRNRPQMGRICNLDRSRQCHNNGSSSQSQSEEQVLALSKKRCQENANEIEKHWSAINIGRRWIGNKGAAVPSWKQKDDRPLAVEAQPTKISRGYPWMGWPPWCKMVQAWNISRISWSAFTGSWGWIWRHLWNMFIWIMMMTCDDEKQ